MNSADLPIWMRRRVSREVSKNVEPPRTRGYVLLMALLAAFTALSTFTGLRYASYFHLPVIAAGFTVFALAVYGRLRCSLRNVSYFVVVAVTTNLAMSFVAYRIGDDSSGAIAVAGVVLFTGLVGLLLFARMDNVPSWKTRAAVFTIVLAFTLTGPVIYLFGVKDGVLGAASGWLLVATLPMVFVLLMTFCVVVSYHKSEVTLPSDKWT
jgi:hypothetical protein